MRTYRNVNNGALIETESEVCGGGWELVETSPASTTPREDRKSDDSAKKTAKAVKSKARSTK